MADQRSGKALGAKSESSFARRALTLFCKLTRWHGEPPNCGKSLAKQWRKERSFILCAFWKLALGLFLPL
jgi:hypothetical protein